MPSNSLPPLRRIVTGHDDANTAKVLLDSPAINSRTGATAATSTLIWCTDSTPTDISIGESFEDMGLRKLGTAPPPSGSRFAIIDFPAGSPTKMHRTETLDYVIVLAGEIDMDMDDSTVSLKAGNVLIQRGTNHSWVNRSATDARVAFVLIDAQPLGIGHAVTGSQAAGTS